MSACHYICVLIRLHACPQVIAASAAAARARMREYVELGNDKFGDPFAALDVVLEPPLNEVLSFLALLVQKYEY